METRPNARRLQGLSAQRPWVWTCTKVLACGLAFTSQFSCFAPSVGDPPEVRQLYFPSGMVLDPRPAEGEAARWLFVVNANSDLAFNGSSLVAVDLNELFSRAFNDPALQATSALTVNSDVLDVGSEVTEAKACRRNVSKPQLIECDETPIIDADTTVYMTTFATVAATWQADPASDKIRLFTPVRGDPSVSYVDISGGLGGSQLKLDCGQGSDPDDPLRCAGEFRLKHLRGDDELIRLASEPANILISKRPGYPVAYVTHLNRPVVTLIDLDGIPESEAGKPVLIDEERLLHPTEVVGGFGIAERPCPPVSEGEDPSQAPGCEAPMVYVGHRELPRIEVASIDVREPGVGQACVDYSDLGEPGGLLCDFEVVAESTFVPQTLGGVGVGELLGAPAFGDMAFSGDGNTLYITQVNPGGLLRVDTSLDTDGEIRDETTGAIEMCAEPQALELFEDGGEEFAAVSCYKPAEIFIVELKSFRVVRQVIAGTGPHEMVYDPVRKVLYAANTLDATISVIDVSKQRETRFTEIARLGLQEPYGG